MFATAHDFIVDTVSKGGKVLFIGTKRQAQEAVKAEAERAGMFFVTHRWMGGTLTNFQTIKRSIDRLKTLEQMFEDGSISKYTKKEAVGMSREVKKLNLALGGIKDMTEAPKAAFVIDPKREQIAIQECRKLGIPVVAVVDSNCDPDMVDYIIPGNDDAIRAIKLFATHMADACVEGARHAERLCRQGRSRKRRKPPRKRPKPKRRPRLPPKPPLRRSKDMAISAAQVKTLREKTGAGHDGLQESTG